MLITVALDGHTDQQFKTNIEALDLIPIDITLPIGGLLVPISVQLHLSINLRSGFSAKNSLLHSQCDLTLDGEIAMRYYHHRWNLPPPQVSMKNNLASDVSGVSMGINSFVFSIDQRIMAGVGVLGFSTGPYAGLYSALTALKQSSTGWPCAQGTFNLQLGADIGFAMPKVVASVINAALSIFGIKPIPAWASIVALPHPVTLVDVKQQLPNGCAGK